MVLYLYLSSTHIPDKTPSIFRNSGYLLYTPFYKWFGLLKFLCHTFQEDTLYQRQSVYFPETREIIGVSLGLLEKYGIIMVLYLYLSNTHIPDETPSIFRNSEYLLYVTHNR
jgi:hypothetical protein